MSEDEFKAMDIEQAGDEIASLRGEVARLRQVLKIVRERVRVGAPIGHEWSVSTEEIISEALGHE